MNDQSAGWSPDSDGDEDDDRPLRSSLERALMERARRAAERAREKPPRPYLQHALALAAALGLVLLLALGFDAFITSMQRVMRMMDEQEQKQQQEQKARPKPAPDPKDPMPAYVVPEK